MATRPPALVDDAMREIFTRLPSDDPRSLVGAAAVCRSWRGILSDPDFARGYRAFHGAAPMLGFLHNKHRTYSTSRAPHWGNHFVPTSTFRPPACQDDRSWRVLDSRHGLVLFYAPIYCTHFVVRDLVTGDHWQFDADPRCYSIMWWEDDTADEYYNGISSTATVLCAKDRCDHLDCHGGPFLVALVGSEYEGDVLAVVYSSETREWSDTVSIQYPDFYINRRGHSAVLGNKVYVAGFESNNVVEYNIREQELSVITLPEDLEQPPYRDLMGVEDGRLLFATVVKPRLYLWSMGAAGPSGAVALAQRAVIELEPLVPPRVLLDIMSEVSAVGFAEGVGVIFVSTAAGLYTIELSSGRHNKVDEHGVDKVMPYMSFCTGAWGAIAGL